MKNIPIIIRRIVLMLIALTDFYSEHILWLRIICIIIFLIGIWFWLPNEKKK